MVGLVGRLAAPVAHPAVAFERDESQPFVLGAESHIEIMMPGAHVVAHGP